MLDGMVLGLAIFIVGMIAGAMVFLCLHWKDENQGGGGGWDARELPDYPPSDLELLLRR